MSKKFCLLGNFCANFYLSKNLRDQFWGNTKIIFFKNLGGLEPRKNLGGLELKMHTLVR